MGTRELEYMADMAKQLSEMAKRSGIESMAYIFNMACLEAHQRMAEDEMKVWQQKISARRQRSNRRALQPPQRAAPTSP